MKRSPNLAESAVGHQVREEELCVLQSILRALEPYDSSCYFLKIRIHVQRFPVMPLRACIGWMSCRLRPLANVRSFDWLAGLSVGRSPSPKNVSAFRLRVPLNVSP